MSGMVKRIKEWRLFAAGAVLVQGCKTLTAEEVQARIPFEVLDRGSEPRALFRYSIPDGTTTTWTTTFTVSKEGKGETTSALSHLRRLEVIASRTSGTGRVELDLRSLRASARASGRVTDEVALLRNGEREYRKINESLEIRIDSRSRILRGSEEP
jgi:hypothetical protein